MSNASLEGYFHIFSLGYPLKHGYDSWQILSHSCIWMNIERMHPPRLTVGPSIFEVQMCTSPHEYEWWTSLLMPMHFFSRSDLTSWEESMVKNFELITMSLLRQIMRGMSGRLGSFQKVGDNIYLKGMFQLEASSWLIDHLDGCWHDVHNQSEDNSQKNPGEKILHGESSNTTLGGRVELDKQQEQ
jgi:hypothetical protein